MAEKPFDKADHAKKQRARFDDLSAIREAILKVATPLREARDAFSQSSHKKLEKMNAEIKAAEKGLFEIDQERASLARTF